MLRATAAVLLAFGLGFALGTELTYRSWRQHYDRLLERHRGLMQRRAELER